MRNCWPELELLANNCSIGSRLQKNDARLGEIGVFSDGVHFGGGPLDRPVVKLALPSHRSVLMNRSNKRKS